MLRWPKQGQGRWAAALVAAALALTLGTLAALAGWRPGGAEPDPGDALPPAVRVQPEGADQLAQAAVIGPATKVVRRIYYRPCRETVERESAPPPHLIGASREALQRAYPQWQVRQWHPERIVLERQTDELCDELLHWRQVRLDGDGVVRVYYGRVGRIDPPLKEETRITAEMLMPIERVRLAEGVELPGDEAVARYLEFDRH